MTSNFRVRSRGKDEVYGSGVVGTSYWKNIQTGNRTSETEVTASGSFVREQTTWDYTRPGPPYTSGGSFLTRIHDRGGDPSGGGSFQGLPRNGSKTDPLVPGTYQWIRCYDGLLVKPNWQGYGDGYFPASYKNTDPDHYTDIHPDNLADLGSRAYSKLRPQYEAASLGQSLAEFREVPGMLKTSAKGFSDLYRSLGGKHTDIVMRKEIADHFLNTVFGWKPFIKDVGQVYNLVADFPSACDKIRRNNGVWQHRRFSEPDQTDETVLFSSSTQTQLPCVPSLTTANISTRMLQSGSIRQTITRKKQTRIWYSGSFKYHLPEFDEEVKGRYPSLLAARQFLTASGANISPTLLYKVTPWTWLVDWFVNVGDNVQRFEDTVTERVVSRYFYLMRTVEDNLVNRVRGITTTGQLVEAAWQLGWTTKCRAPGDHFGFTSPPSGYSGMQLAILGALGISKFT